MNAPALGRNAIPASGAQETSEYRTVGPRGKTHPSNVAIGIDHRSPDPVGHEGVVPQDVWCGAIFLPWNRHTLPPYLRCFFVSIVCITNCEAMETADAPGGGRWLNPGSVG
jgi:hypothetical protein